MQSKQLQVELNMEFPFFAFGLEQRVGKASVYKWTYSLSYNGLDAVSDGRIATLEP